MKIKPPVYGQLAAQAGYQLPLEVQQSAAGFYLGTVDEEGPMSRESVEYFPTREAAQRALDTGDWQQREHP